MTEDEEFEALEQRLNMKEQEYEQINHPNGVTTWKTKPKEQPKALRLADYLADRNRLDITCDEAAAELRRLHQHEVAHSEWLDKTEWVQDTAHYSELGEHRADVIKKRFDRLHALNQELLEALELALFAHGKMLLSDPPQEAWKTYEVESKARAAIAKAQGASNE